MIKHSATQFISKLWNATKAIPKALPKAAPKAAPRVPVRPIHTPGVTPVASAAPAAAATTSAAAAAPGWLRKTVGGVLRSPVTKGGLYATGVLGMGTEAMQQAGQMYDYGQGRLDGTAEGIARSQRSMEDMPWWKRMGWAMAPAVGRSQNVRQQLLEQASGKGLIGGNIERSVLLRAFDMQDRDRAGQGFKAPTAPDYMSADNNFQIDYLTKLKRDFEAAVQRQQQGAQAGAPPPTTR